MDKWFCLIAGGVLGTLSRYVLAGMIFHKTGPGFPYGTLIVNLIGCFLIGFFDTIFHDKLHLSSMVRVFLMAGFCGAFTTFSALMLDTSNLIRDGETARAFLYVMMSVTIGFILFRGGVLLGKIF